MTAAQDRAARGRQPASGHADLTGKDCRRLLDRRGCGLQVDVEKNQYRRLTAKFQLETPEVLGACGRGRPAGSGAAGEADLRHIWRGGQMASAVAGFR